MPYQIIQNKVLPADAPAGGAQALEWFSSGLRLKTDDHLKLETMVDGRSVRINSRNVSQAAGDHTAVSIKPNKSADGTGAMTGLEVSPRFAASMGGSNLRAILGDPLLKAGSGDLTGAVVAFEANIDFGVSGTRTITGNINAFSSFLAIPSTYTYSGDIAFLRVRAINIKAWDYFLDLDDASTGVETLASGTYSTAQGYLKIKIGGTDYRLPYYDAVD